jgi:hypothetical protein
MSWAKERDLLISQTMAFVQSIAAPKPETGIRALSRTQPMAVNRADPFISADTVIKADPVAKTDPVAKAELVVKAEPVERPAEITPMARLALVPPGALREEVQNRVAAFRAQQQHFLRERDAYFHAVLDKARGSTDSPRQSSGS